MAIAGLAADATLHQVSHPARFQELYNQHADSVYRTALRITGNHADAEDVLQTVFARMLDHQRTPGAGGSPESYLRRAAMNGAIDLLRRRTSRAESPIDTSGELRTKDSPVLLKESLRRALAQLDPEDAELFALCYVEGFSYEELAEQFRIERGTVASRLFRIRLELKRQLDS